MEKGLRSSLQKSADEFLSSATKIGFKTVKPSLKTVIWGIARSSDLSSSLPLALHRSVTCSIESFKKLLESNKEDNVTESPCSPPKKQLLRSTRRRKNAQDSNDEGSLASKLSSKKQVLLQNLELYAYVLSLCVSHPKKTFSDSGLLPSVQALHDSLILFESSQELQSAIAGLCEEWWKEQFQGRETLISQSLPFLVSRSLTLLKKVDAHRVYALREAFSLLDFEDESIEDLKFLLVRCIITPLYYKTEDGRRFIAHLFGLSEQLLKEALAIIRAQIPLGRKSALDAYADIIFRGWKILEGSSKHEVESRFMQELVEGAIHASSASLAASLRRVLGGFVNQRTTDGVEKLLFRLSEPVIFRALQVANSNVRQNALHLLLDLFPLEDPDATKEVKDAMLDKQFFLLERLLQDECPGVRVVAVEGSCHILHLFWEIIPSSTITKTITKIVNDCSHDICNEVRLSTLNGIMHLLGNPQTHEILKVLMPRLGDLFLDPVLSVRMAVADLLLAVRDIRTFQFHKVVDIDALLSSLANDQPPVAKKITRLLIPTYFPSKVALEEACSRCVTLIKRSPNSGARFCEFALTEGSSARSIMELLRFLVNLAISSNDLVADLIEGVIDAAANLCKSLVNETPCKDELRQLFSGQKLKQLFAQATTEHAQATVLSIASSVSPDDEFILVPDCMILIKSCGCLSDNFEKQEEVRSAHKLMLSSGRFDEVFVALMDPLQATVSCCIKLGIKVPNHGEFVKQKKDKSSMKQHEKMKSVKKTEGSKSFSDDGSSNFQQLYISAAGAAWQIKDLLSSPEGRDAVLKSPMLDLAFSALKVISEVSIKHCMCSGYIDTAPILAYTALTMHATLQNIDTMKDGCKSDKNNGYECRRMPLRGMMLDNTLNHLFHCTEKILSNFPSGNCGKLCIFSVKYKQEAEKTSQHQIRKAKKTTNNGSSVPNDKKTFNFVKMVTAVLKFIVDATTVGLISQNEERCLRFVSMCLQITISILKRHSDDIVQSKEEEALKDMLLCLKSSFTYAAKLVNLILQNSHLSSIKLQEASNLANNLINLIMSVELYLGSKHATCLLSATKQWLPDLILALCCQHVLAGTLQEGDCSNTSDQDQHFCLPWLKVLGKSELHELRKVNHDDEAGSVPEPKTFPVLKKALEMMLLCSRRNQKVLDSIGVIFLTGIGVLLSKGHYGLVWGLVHFTCMKLLGCTHREWDNLELMLASLRQLYPKLDEGIKNLEISENGRIELEHAKVLLDSAWMTHMGQHGSNFMEEI